MTDAQLVFLEALVALVVALSFVAKKPDLAFFRHPAIVAALVVFCAGAIVRALVVVPSLIHADMLGTGFVDSYLAFPDESRFRLTYGGFGYFAVGAMTWLCGHDTEAVFRAMQVFGLVDVALLAALAFRLSRSPYAVLFAVAFSITSPVLMRVAASEDMHNFALAPGLLALVCIDQYATSRRLPPLLAAVISLALMLHTRQTFYLFAPAAFLLALARGGPTLLRAPAFWVAGGGVLAVMIQRMIATSSVEGGALPKIVGVLFEPVLVWPILRNHPCFDVVRFGLLPLVTIAALVWSIASGPVPRALFVAFALSFVATYTCGFSSPGVEFAQRMPAYALGVVSAAIFGAAMLESRVPESTRARFGVVVGLVFACSPALLPGWRSVRSETTDYREVRLVESMASSLPGRFTLVILPSPEILEGYSRYAGLLRRRGKHVDVALSTNLAGAREPLVFLEGVECWTYTFRELTGAHDEPRDARRLGLRFDRTLFGREPSPIRPPPRMRDECRALLAQATPIGPPRRIDHPVDDPPFLFYAASPVPVRFHRLARRPE